MPLKILFVVDRNAPVNKKFPILLIYIQQISNSKTNRQMQFILCSTRNNFCLPLQLILLRNINVIATKIVPTLPFPESCMLQGDLFFCEEQLGNDGMGFNDCK